MAEFCLDCYNKEFGEKLTKRDVYLSECLCEGCGQIKPCVISIRRRSLIFKIFDFFSD